MRRKVFVILALVFTMVFSPSVLGAKSISELNKESSSIKNKITETRKYLNSVKDDKSDLLKEIEALDDKLNAVQAELDVIQGDLDIVNGRLEESQAELKDAVYARTNQYENMKKRIRVMYESGTIGYAQIILEAKGFADLIRRLEYINCLMNYDNNVLGEYKRAEETIAEKVVSITEDKAKVDELYNQQNNKKKTLNDNISEKNALVAKLNSDEKAYLQQISDLEKEDAKIQSLIRSASGYTRSTGSSSNKVYSSTNTRYQYPVPATSGTRPNSGYGYRSSPISGRSEFHTGVDLRARLGYDIVAAESGVVIFAGWKGGYGNTVIVDHGGGMTTLYAHNSKLVVSVGTSVSRGQVIAKAGTTGYSTGVHLHFEVRKNGKHVNPNSYIYD